MDDDGEAASRRALVRDGYDRIAEAYGAWEEARDVKQRHLARLAELVPAGGRVLDLGCGTGERVTRHLLERYEVVAVDVSPHSIEVAEEKVPGADYRCADMVELDLEPDSFDGVVAFFSVIHVPREEQAGVLASIHRWLRPGGTAIVTLGAADGEGIGSFFGADMFWSSWSPEQNLALVREAGFEVVAAEEVAEEEHGEPVTFLWVVLRKP